MEFDSELVNGKFYKYKPIHIGDLERELLYGSLSRAELKKVLIRDFTMYASRLFVHQKVKYGTWVNAMHQISQYFGGTTTSMNKQQLVDKSLELIPIKF